MHPRGILRRDIRAAVIGATPFQDVSALKTWSQNIDPDTLPALGVFTPREPTSQASVGQVTRGTEVIVLLIRQGADDLDDQLDDDSAVIEGLVLPVLASASGEHGLLNTETDFPGDGAKRIGRLIMTFRADRFTREGQQQ